jgi:small subunit ribosomal protein S2
MFIFFTISQLVLKGVHVGHSIANTPLFASWMLFAFRQNTWFINILKTYHLFRKATKLLKFVVHRRKPIWFINLDQAMSQVIKFAALRCGEFYVNTFWIRGMLCNFRYAAVSFTKLAKININLFKNAQINKRFSNFKKWFFTRFTLPGTIITFSAYHSAFVVTEALDAGVPCIGIVDTNISGHAVTAPIPGNDDSLEAMAFYGEIISSVVLFNKFAHVFGWYMGTRKSSRLIGFEDWLKKYKHKKSKIKYLYNSFLKRFIGYSNTFSICYINLWEKSSHSLSAINYWTEKYIANFQCIYKNNLSIEKEKIFSTFSFYWFKFLNLVKTFNNRSQGIKSWFLTFCSRRRRTIRFRKKRGIRFLLKRFLPKTSAWAFINEGTYVYRKLSELFKNFFNNESNRGPFHLFLQAYLSNGIRLRKNIIAIPQYEFLNRLKFARFPVKGKRRKKSKFLDKYLLLNENDKYIDARFISNSDLEFDGEEHRFFFHTCLIHIYLRLIFKYLGYRFWCKIQLNPKLNYFKNWILKKKKYKND